MSSIKFKIFQVASAMPQQKTQQKILHINQKSENCQRVFLSDAKKPGAQNKAVCEKQSKQRGLGDH